LSWVVFIAALSILVLIDFYVFQGAKVLLRKWPFAWRRAVYFGYWGATTYILISFLFYKILGPQAISPHLQRWSTVLFFIIYVSKLPALFFLIVDDGIRFVRWAIVKMSQPKDNYVGQKISRSKFLVQASVVAAAIPATSLGFGILSGAYDYRLRRKKIPITGLPDAFHGMKIGQLSDIHSGSFFNKTAVEGGVDLLMQEKPDLFVFTGDLVNNETSEVEEYKQIFAKATAPLGAYSTLGNHDYGDYRKWSSAAAKQKNLDDLVQVHKEMGWDLLRDENRTIKVDGEELALIGVDNWGAGRFAKYGSIAKAYEGTEDISTKILLSHDPSHWDEQIRPGYGDIDLMLAGHTHGFQFGVEIGNFRWSPSQYMYKQWADLYTEGSQHLYVNRGFGFIGYPGRVGILPEVTILELVKA
jgi:predicted MPP superfamily phosphohydrolase